MALKLKPADQALRPKLQAINSTLTTLAQASDRWKPLRALAKQQTSEAPPRPPLPSADDPGPVWTKRMDTLFGSPDEPLRVIRCDCGLQTREVNGRACVTHKGMLSIHPIPYDSRAVNDANWDCSGLRAVETGTGNEAAESARKLGHWDQETSLI